MDKYQKSHKDKLFKSRPFDPYATPLRPGGSARCPQCGAVYHDGEWHLHGANGLAPVESTVCPACRRMEDRAAAGQVRVSGRFLTVHEQEIRQLMQRVEQQERQTHVLERLIAIDSKDDALLVTTTGTHLANRIGHELQAAYDGACSYRYSDSERYLSVDWHRD
ncbi:BCAM0308 family protein [Pseudomonas vlassakiae]|jgi:NMD protein affecting ribosome stability and mRNA decay|uniref:BCAM0308 family protein n=1 Tax=Pseudomonas TaxID=286 RepID=UPI0006D3B72A|nr:MULTISPECIES: BCAM0308 family protein [Pseudomonas]AXQ48460.1 ATPase [Stenotrophomonas rhizophila]MBS3185587.1 ATPase [Pseudomonas sp. PCH44]MCU0122866.1 BCAM0308 family protein [Pseudomonas vlassakiae]PIK80456.1 ATPase [Pseudomonas sp. 382]HCV38916.1 ATPase [Pseudomonas sp.]